MNNSTKGYQVFKVFNTLILIAVIIVTLIPCLNILAKSFSDMKHLDMNTVTIFPQGFNIDTYKILFKDHTFWLDYRNTIYYTIFGTVISLLMTALFAYTLSVPRLKGKKFFMGLVVLTMFFNGGIIPNFLLVRNLEMRNTVWAMVIPGAISTFNLIVMRTFFQEIPQELQDAAAVDGMNTYGIFFRIILPLSKPILATMALFYAVGAWNSWFNALLYLDHANMQPVTLYLRNLIAGATIQSGTDADALGAVSANIKAVCIVVTSVPIICIYPFLQKYFVKGVMIGSLKG